MFRLGKLTDYGIRILAHLARQPEASPRNAREIAEEMGLPAPAVSKVMKLLARDGVLESQRGAKGGYCLGHRPEELSVARMIAALEGPVAMTQCTVAAEHCEYETRCEVKGPWQVINEVVQGALEAVTLADLIDPRFPAEASAQRLLQVGELPAIGATGAASASSELDPRFRA